MPDRSKVAFFYLNLLFGGFMLSLTGVSIRVCWLLFFAAISLVGTNAPAADKTIRVATFNVSLNRDQQRALIVELEKGESLQVRRIAETIQRVRPDIILLNEFDYDADRKAIGLFQKNFLAVSQHEQQPIEYPYQFTAPVNTGVLTGFDLNDNGSKNDPDDAFGFGRFPGQYGMVVLSQYPIDEKRVRTFQKFLWQQMPDALLPIDPETHKLYYSEDILEKFRLSSKSHWDVPIQIDQQTVHFLVSHPTPPVFDGAEDRNGRRNHDEIRFWADYIDPKRSSYIVDDLGGEGGLGQDALFVIAGDMNADPLDGDSSQQAIRQLLDHPLINSKNIPSSSGASQAAQTQGGKNLLHLGDSAHDTGDFRDDTTGNMRIDYVLPSPQLQVTDAQVFWPTPTDPGNELLRASDHRLVWIDFHWKN
jgi:endonuclease/exonuclease/phosphatase family metal-dependent hydrolase